METCGNCGRSIGELETPHLWNEKILFSICYPALTGTITSTARTAQISDYRGLNLASSIFMVNAALAYILCIPMLALGIMVALTQSSAAEGIKGLQPIGVSLALFLEGAISHGASAACIALRNIAIDVSKIASKIK
jgi:hypothetical protein